MLSLTRKSDYALVALVSLAERPDELQSARELADRLNLPQAALRNILKDLTRSGMLDSIQGTSGGYRLARDASDISLADVIQVIEGPVRLTTCCSTDTAPESEGCRREDGCRIKATVRGINQRLSDFLTTVSLAELAREAIQHREQSPVTLVGLDTQPHGATA
jgi:Rrf2 family protein